jgi:alpha-ketoglutarate-dependent taurine dioxygenase
MTKITIENATPLVGGIVHIDKAHLCDDDVVAQIKAALETRGVLVFPQLHASDEEQLAFTDKMGERVNFTRQVPGSDVSASDVYKITLDRKLFPLASFPPTVVQPSSPTFTQPTTPSPPRTSASTRTCA